MSRREIPEADDLYPEIGQLIFDKIPDEFQNAWMSVEMIDDVASYGMYYLKPNGRIQVLYDGLSGIVKKFRELRNRFESSGCEAWTGATFVLSSEGRFSVDYTYDDVSDFGEAAEREEAWIKKYLGDSPIIDRP